MIRFLRGTYLYYEAGSIVLETSAGIGFRVNVSDTSTLLNYREGDEIEVYTYLQVKEDGMSLYGFADTEGLKLFELLITVNGVGPKAALAIMSLGTPNQIKGVIAAGDSASISQAQGVGKKTAERVILELSDKVDVLPINGDEIQSVGVKSNAPGSAERNEAIVALTTLGYTKREAESAVALVQDENLKSEEYIRKALKNLM